MLTNKGQNRNVEDRVSVTIPSRINFEFSRTLLTPEDFLKHQSIIKTQERLVQKLYDRIEEEKRTYMIQKRRLQELKKNLVSTLKTN